jgi:hypothetical protein
VKEGEERRMRNSLTHKIGQIASASTMARILSSIPITSHGPAKIVIYDIHALQVIDSCTLRMLFDF